MTPRRKTETVEHYSAILLEDLKSKMELVIEGMHSTKTELKRDMHEFEIRVNERFDILETVVKKNSLDIKGLKSDVSELKSDVSELKSDVSGLKSDVSGLKSDVSGLKSDVSELKSDVSELKSDVKSIRTEMKEMENRLSDKIGGSKVHIDDHEKRITNLETARL